MPTGLGDEVLWLSATNDNTGSSTAFADQSGNGNNGTANNGVLVVTDSGEGGSYAYDFDGVNDYIDLGTSTGIGQSSTFSLSIWAKADALASTSALISKYNRNNNRGFLLRMPSQPTWLTASSLSNSNFNRTITSSQTVSTQTWYHIAATYDVATDAMELFIDGVSVATGQAAGTITTTTVAMMIGRYENNEYNGRADDVRAYNRVLTGEEITHLATSRGIQGSPGTTNSQYNAFATHAFKQLFQKSLR
ncbi:MAG: LamG domain-containing protein [Fuerstiella sp.]|nr:LamG domain-containing protein [Fuerstiella sp.]